MVVHSSNLALRFYAKDGWTQPILDVLTIRGKVRPHPGFEEDEKSGWGGYYLPDLGTEMNIPLLMQLVTKVHRRFDDYPEESDESFIRRMIV